MKKSKNEEALIYLNQNPLLHMSMIEPIKRGQAIILYAETDGAMLMEIRSGAYMISASTPEVGKRLIDGVDAGLFLIHQDFCIPMLIDKYQFQNMYNCVQAVYTKKEPLPIGKKFDVHVLDNNHTETVIKYYHSMDDPKYILSRIENGEMYGAFINGKMAGFIGVHEEGSIGLLEVIPEYRNMGVGASLESFMINLHLQNSWTPFCNIFEDNDISLHLQRKLGLAITEEHIYWLF